MKKIMFNDKYGLTQSVLECRKTMTRRIIHIPNKRGAEDVCYYQYRPHEHVTRPGFHATVELLDAHEASFDPEKYVLSEYKVGEIVAIAQSYHTLSGKGDPVMVLGEEMGDGRVKLINSKKLPGWENKMFVKAEHMPHHIRITGIRVENLKAISDEDILREGVIKVEYCENGSKVAYTYGAGRISDWKNTPVAAFAELIDKTCGRFTWNSNPLVWVYEFELVD